MTILLTERKQDSIPQLFPWQRRAATPSISTTASTPTLQESSPTPTPNLSPSDVVYHDHCYFTSHAQPSTHLTPIVDSTVALPSSTVTVDVGIQTCISPFRIEDIADDNAAIHFYTGFNNYKMLRICYDYLGVPVHHLKYWGSTNKVSSVENRGSSRSLTPLNEFFASNTMWANGERSCF